MSPVVELSAQAQPRQPFQTAQLVEIWCMEPVFFASRELSDSYYTEGTLGNYALAYALGWARSPYRLASKESTQPRYLQDLGGLDCYILPAWNPEGSVSFRFERFNALSDSYWYAMTNNRVATARADILRVRQGDKPSSFRPSNFPQTGRLRMIERGNRFHTLVLGERELPDYIRVGKFMSKARVQVLQRLPVELLPPGQYQCQSYLNIADLPAGLNFLSFDLISMPPASLLKNLRFEGPAWRIGNYLMPANLRFCQGVSADA
jgi:CRISPR-associated protein Csc1